MFFRPDAANSNIRQIYRKDTTVLSKLILSIHPFFQGIGIILAFYGAFLGIQRVRILHFDRKNGVFQRKRHALIGAIALFLLLGGFGGGFYIAGLVWQGMVVINLHRNIALTILPFLLVAIATGLYLYFSPARRRILPAIHGLNNAVLLILLLLQAYSGIQVYLQHVLKIP